MGVLAEILLVNKTALGGWHVLSRLPFSTTALSYNHMHQEILFSSETGDFLLCLFVCFPSFYLVHQSDHLDINRWSRLTYLYSFLGRVHSQEVNRDVKYAPWEFFSVIFSVPEDRIVHNFFSSSMYGLLNQPLVFG